ncbi:MAG: hypothetical protein Fur0010_26330 [Bdellovibrio sp.]
MIKRYKKPVVQLTSLLDLLFVMVFASMLQSKASPQREEVKSVETTKAEVKVEAPKPKKYKIEATFNFYATANSPSVPNGAFRMEGTFDEKTGFLNLSGSEWINRPSQYDMVPLRGNVDEGRSIFTGKIEFPGCREFTLKRVPKNGQSPLAGTWQGAYKCLQGETGLTLEIN